VIANMVFLASWGWTFPLLHVGLAFVNFFLAQRLLQRKILLWICVALDLAILAFFKLRGAGNETDLTHQLILPLGLSFYTLQMLGYVFEVQRKRVSPTNHFFDFLLFTSFFPTVAMGPIERFHHLSHQLNQKRQWNSQRSLDGLFLICLGIFKKMAIADSLFGAIDLANHHESQCFGAGLLLFCLLSFIQLYADFSGYIDIARGIAKLLGIDLVENFNQPYRAQTIVDILRRWNITLITWMTDFVYWPLLLKTRNIYLSALTVLLVTGLWHGLTLHYLLWSLYWSAVFSAYLVVRRYRIKFVHRLSPLIKQAATVTLAALASLPFMAQSISDYFDLLKRLVFWTPSSLFSIFEGGYFTRQQLMFAFICTITMIVAETIYHRSTALEWSSRAPRFVAFIFLMIFMTAAFGVSDARSFIYMRY
jgi:D-alanyl-lipoteichoic acid acyltransferase DltB (MBOAT superfamily)